MKTDVQDIMYGLWMRCGNLKCRWLGDSEQLCERPAADGVGDEFACPKCGGRAINEHPRNLKWHEGLCAICGQPAKRGKPCKKCVEDGRTGQT